MRALASAGTITAAGALGVATLMYGGPFDGAASATTLSQESSGTCPANATDFRGSNRTITCTCPSSATRSGAVWGTDTYTDDSAICRAAVHAGVIGSEGGVVSVRITSGQSSYPASSRNGVNSVSYGNWGGSYRFVSISQAPTRASSGSETQLASIWNSAGCSFTDTSPLIVNSTSQLDRLELWRNWANGESSTRYEVTDSSGRIVHSGSLERLSCDTYQTSWCVAGDRPGINLSAGRYQIRVPSGRICQNSSSDGRGFIRAWGRTSSSTSQSTTAANVSACPTNAIDMRGSGRTITCSCSSSATSSGSVWGTNTYTDDSKICRAAVHAGVIGSSGGNVTFRVTSGQGSYAATSRNGVNSTRYGSWQGSYRFVR